MKGRQGWGTLTTSGAANVADRNILIKRPGEIGKQIVPVAS